MSANEQARQVQRQSLVALWRRSLHRLRPLARRARYATQVVARWHEQGRLPRRSAVWATLSCATHRCADRGVAPVHHSRLASVASRMVFAVRGHSLRGMLRNTPRRALRLRGYVSASERMSLFPRASAQSTNDARQKCSTLFAKARKERRIECGDQGSDPPQQSDRTPWSARARQSRGCRRCGNA